MKLNDKDILKKLSERSTGFKTPSGYFDSIEDRFTNKRIKNIKGFRLPEINNDQHLNNERTLGFKVPEGYFEDPIDRFLPSETKVRQLPKLKYLKVALISTAASLLLFFSLKFYNYEQDKIQLSELNTDEIASWVDEDLIAFESYDIAEVFNEITLDSDMYSEEEELGYLNNIDMEEIILEN